MAALRGPAPRHPGLRGLSDADLTNANLTRADLSYATLVNADLSDADLSNTYLIGAILIGANLTNAEYDEFTLFPSGDDFYDGFDAGSWGLPDDATPWDLGMIPTPEPSAGLMLMIGGGWLAGFASRRR